MKIAGLQKMTLLDYPGKIACTVFLQGCNFRCPFCHNSDLLGGAGEQELQEAAFFRFLEKRQGMLDGVCVSGGEPTLQEELEQFIGKIKQLGYAVKLDTNGSRPQMLKNLVQAGLVDYVAMDIKNGPAHYADTAGMSGKLLPDIEESIRFLLSDAVAYEFRTTVVDELHSAQSVEQMGKWLCQISPGCKPARLFIQPYVDRDSVLQAGLHTPQAEKLVQFQQILAPYVQEVFIRGTE